MDKKTYIIIISGVVIILVALLANKFLRSDKQDSDNETKIKLVENYSDFFTVNGCATKYINYLTSEDNDALIKVLNETYAEKNSITKENVLTKLDNFSGRSLTFNANKMYEEVLDKKVKKYYVKGFLKEDTIEGSSNVGEYYLIITIDNGKKLFDVTPYDGKMFKEEA